MPPVRDHVVVIGSSSTAVRLVDELERAGERVMVLVVDDATHDDVGYYARQMAEAGAEIRTVTTVREAELRQVNVAAARAAVVLGFDDVATTRIALALDELNPKLRLVLELSHPSFADRLSSLLGECVVMSSAQLAAPRLSPPRWPGVNCGPSSSPGVPSLPVPASESVARFWR